MAERGNTKAGEVKYKSRIIEHIHKVYPFTKKMTKEEFSNWLGDMFDQWLIEHPEGSVEYEK